MLFIKGVREGVLVLAQLINFIEDENIYKETVTGFRKNYGRNAALMKLRDDIRKAMKSSEVTLAVLVDFSKAFDTICHNLMIKKLHQLGFSKNFLWWTFSYLENRKQYVQIDNKSSSIEEVKFGVPQGTILGPILFNLYANDLQNDINMKTIQYADDTTLYIQKRYHFWTLLKKK